MTDIYNYSFQREEKGYHADGCWSEYIDTDVSLNEEEEYYNGEYSDRTEMIVRDKTTEDIVSPCGRSTYPSDILAVVNYTRTIIYEPDFGGDKISFDIQEDQCKTRLDVYSPNPDLKTKEMIHKWITVMNNQCKLGIDTEEPPLHRYKKLPKIKCEVCRERIYPPDIVIADDTIVEEFYQTKCKKCSVNVERQKKIKEIQEQIVKLQEELKNLKRLL